MPKLVVVAGPSCRHPLLAMIRHHWGETQERPDLPTGTDGGWNAVVVDCATVGAPALAGSPGLGPLYRAGTALVLLDATVEHKQAIAGHVPAVSAHASAASFLVRLAASGASHDFAFEIGGCPEASSFGEVEERVDPAVPPADAGRPCGASGGRRWSAEVREEHYRAFQRKVLPLLTARATLPAEEPPAGLKHFTYTMNWSRPWDEDGQATVLDTTYVYRGFLNQSATETYQIVSCESFARASPGSLKHDNDEDRGWFNSWYEMVAYPDSGLPLAGFRSGPSSSGDPIRQTITVPISYPNPIGGYKSWDYVVNFDQAIPSWLVDSRSAGAELGALYRMKSPYNGFNQDDWKDAFTTWGHVKDLPGLCVHTLPADTVAIWRSSTLLSGSRLMRFREKWGHDRLNSSSCFLGQCAKIHIHYGWLQWDGAYYIDFTPISAP